MNWKQKILLIYFIILPFVDLVTSLITRFTDLTITLGIIIKGLTVIFGVFYVLFITKSKYKKKSIIYFLITFLFGIIYFLTKSDIWQLNNIVTEFINAFKYLYYPIMFICFYILFDDLKIDNKFIKKIILINCISYSLLLLIPYFTGTSFNSYFLHFMEGSNGWFYAANETGAILILLSVCIYDLMDNQKKWKILLAIPIMYAISLIGTKVSFLGISIIVFMIILVFIIKNKENRYFLPTCLFVIFLCCSLNSSFTDNIYSIIDSNNMEQNNSQIIEGEQESNIENNKQEKPNNNLENKVPDKETDVENEENNETNNDIVIEYKRLDDLIQNEKIKKVINLLLSGRADFFLKNFSVYKDSGIKNILFGLSWSNRLELNYVFDKKLIEIDFFDILIHYGIFGLVIYLLPLIYYLFKLLKNIKFINLENLLYILVFLLSIGISMLAGHVLGAPSVTVYIILIMIITINNIKEIKEQKEF